MTKKKWALKKQAPGDFFSGFSQYPKFFSQLLWSLNIKNSSEAERFLSPDYERDQHDPHMLKNIDKAAQRIWQAAERREKIMVYGDYDADGISASVILSEFFKTLDYPFGIYMPDRQSEGYGLNMKAVEGFIKEKIQLIITLDCGTTNHAEIALAQKNGIDVIVIDHHQLINGPSPAYALINQHQSDDEYPFKGLCGTGLAFKLFQVLIKDKRAGENWQDGKEKWMLDLVALATVADMMPLLDENRVFVKFGLLVLAQARRPGMRELLRSAGIKPQFSRQERTTNLDSLTISFSLGPRINAASRMAHADLAYNLLMAQDKNKAEELALELEKNNTERKKKIETVSREVLSRIKKAPIPDFIIESSADWPITILGLIANRIGDRYARPLMLINEQGETSKASLRAPEGFDVLKALESVEDLLIQFGGHKAAAGCSLNTKNIPLVKERLEDYAAKHLTQDIKIPKLEIDAELNAEDINLKNAQITEILAPFGMGNPQPKFLVKAIVLKETKFLGNEGKHAKLFFEEGLAALLFFHNGRAGELEAGVKYDIVGELSVNKWNGREEAQFKILDIKQNG